MSRFEGLLSREASTQNLVEEPESYKIEDPATILGSTKRENYCDICIQSCITAVFIVMAKYWTYI